MKVKYSSVITDRWKVAKALIQENKLEEADDHITESLDMLATYTEKGFTVVEKVKLDIWKERFYFMLENAGLLPE